jgi:hypothetical protein
MKTMAETLEGTIEIPVNNIAQPRSATSPPPVKPLAILALFRRCIVKNVC